MNIFDWQKSIEQATAILDRTELDDALMTDDDREAMQALVDGLKTQGEVIADQVIEDIRQRERKAARLVAEAKAIEEEAKALRDDAKAIEATVATRKRVLLKILDVIEQKKLVGSTFTLSKVQNGGKAPLDIFAPEDTLPERFSTVIRKANREAIYEALTKGDEEAARFASLMDRGYTVRIK